MDLAFRPATERDRGFAFRVTEDAMRPYIVATWGVWDEADQRRLHDATFTPSTHSVLVLARQPAGIVAGAAFASHLQLDKLYLLAAWRNRGVGTRVLDRLCAAAALAGKPVRLRVLRANVAAQRLYERFGFRVTLATPERLFMERAPDQP